jgi:hypothetical protein
LTVPAAGILRKLEKALSRVLGASMPAKVISFSKSILVGDRAYGMSVRCIKSKPDTDTTGEYQAVVSGTLLRNVWLDRNLGATQKATSGTDSNAIAKASSWDSKEAGEGFIKSIRCINAS